MTVDEFKKLTGDEQKAWLEKQTGELGRTVPDICTELGISRAQLQGLGHTYAINQWRYLSFENRASVNCQN